MDAGAVLLVGQCLMHGLRSRRRRIARLGMGIVGLCRCGAASTPNGCTGSAIAQKGTCRQK